MTRENDFKGVCDQHGAEIYLENTRGSVAHLVARKPEDGVRNVGGVGRDKQPRCAPVVRRMQLDSRSFWSGNVRGSGHPERWEFFSFMHFRGRRKVGDDWTWAHHVDTDLV